MTEHTTSFHYQARYFQLGDITADTKHLWIVFHGYAQLAKYFIHKFRILEEHGIVVIAPEGLSKFYTRDVRTTSTEKNRVGASWMTKENRSQDIVNNIAYVQSIYDKLEIPISTQLTIFGFSQGAATACRWAIESKIPFARLILWAGVFPPDIDFSAGKSALKNKQILVVQGDQDPLITPERTTEQHAIFEQLHVIPTLITFHGEHELHEPTLLSLG
jgi:predicted esterase